ncbi:hypothetical protein AK88_00887 [Plasmodium fragile]|uniref:Uncharacterized protein n=1 Tax=Plasmodium fragile TaxID=5857 RepID=A0A0D9QQV3_PLAFR|nr:uncharacterized protein AK88_00887 [Plasmodium fragile]KJP89444.1 hypothetical protein AK88_00887 [Plasmodium fragile]
MFYIKILKKKIQKCKNCKKGKKLKKNSILITITCNITVNISAFKNVAHAGGLREGHEHKPIKTAAHHGILKMKRLHVIIFQKTRGEKKMYTNKCINERSKGKLKKNNKKYNSFVKLKKYCVNLKKIISLKLKNKVYTSMQKKKA